VRWGLEYHKTVALTHELAASRGANAPPMLRLGPKRQQRRRRHSTEEPGCRAGKLASASGSPASYFEASFTVDAGKPYHLWLRMKADNDAYTNDSVFVQFSGLQSGTGTPLWRIGSSDAAAVSLEEGNGAGLQGWGWNDSAYGSLGAPVYFSGGTQKIRIQVREDGVSIDQIVLSAAKYLNTSPGSLKNDTKILAEVGGTSGGPPPPPGINEVVIHANTVSSIVGSWSQAADGTAADGVRLWNPNAGAGKLTTASASPASYFQATFTADAAKPYHLWLRMKADGDSYTNDSVFVQFSGWQGQTGTPVWRIGTTDAAPVSLEEGNGAGMQGWGWNDDAYGSLGTPVYFSGGTQTIRIQVREDGVSIDQIVLSAVQYLNTSPGSFKNDNKILPATRPDGM
jgi:hypothetical protein